MRCGLCVPRIQRRRNRAHREDAVQHCGQCASPVCERHVRWDPDGNRWVCARCERSGVSDDAS